MRGLEGKSSRILIDINFAYDTPEVAATVAYNCASVTVVKVQRHRGEEYLDAPLRMQPCGRKPLTGATPSRVIPVSLSPLFLSPLSSSVRREDERERKRDTKGEESEREEAEERHRASERERRPDGGERVA